MTFRVGVVGARGQLGRYLDREIGKLGGLEPIPFDRRRIDVTDRESIESALHSHPVDAIVNTAAYHAADSEGKVYESFLVNAVGARYLAEACAARGIHLVHISTDYVFSGRARRPYVETSRPGPVNVYGLSKLAGEMAVRLVSKSHCVVRVAGLYGVGGCRAKNDTNFVETIIGKAERGEVIQVVHDQVCSPTYALDAAHAIARLVMTRSIGTYHVTNQGSCSWFEFAREIITASGLDAACEPVQTNRRPGEARRPRFTALESRNLHRVPVPELRGWRDALRAYLGERKTTRDR